MSVNWDRRGYALSVGIALFVVSATFVLTLDCPSSRTARSVDHAGSPLDPNQRICKRDYLVGGQICRTRREWEEAARRGVDF